MFIASVVVSVLLALAVGGSGVMKLTKNDGVLAGMDAVNVPRDRVWVLGSLEIAAALGLIVGIFWWPLGVAAAIGVVLYFVGAIVAHIRAGDTKGLGAPAALLVLGVAALVLRLLSV